MRHIELYSNFEPQNESLKGIVIGSLLSLSSLIGNAHSSINIFQSKTEDIQKNIQSEIDSINSPYDSDLQSIMAHVYPLYNKDDGNKEIHGNIDVVFSLMKKYAIKKNYTDISKVLTNLDLKEIGKMEDESGGDKKKFLTAIYDLQQISKHIDNHRMMIFIGVIILIITTVISGKYLNAAIVNNVPEQEDSYLKNNANKFKLRRRKSS